MRQDGLTAMRPETLRSARSIMHMWEQDVAEFGQGDRRRCKDTGIEMNHARDSVGEAVVFRGRSFNMCAAIINYLDDNSTNVNDEAVCFRLAVN